MDKQALEKQAFLNSLLIAAEKIERQKALITELCDALEDVRDRYDVGHGYIDLEKRAREATR